MRTYKPFHIGAIAIMAMVALMFMPAPRTNANASSASISVSHVQQDLSMAAMLREQHAPPVGAAPTGSGYPLITGTMESKIFPESRFIAMYLRQAANLGKPVKMIFTFEYDSPEFGQYSDLKLDPMEGVSHARLLHSGGRGAVTATFTHSSSIVEPSILLYWAVNDFYPEHRFVPGDKFAIRAIMCYLWVKGSPSGWYMPLPDQQSVIQ